MTRIIAVYGTLAGLTVAVPMIFAMLTMTEGPQNGALYGYTLMLLSLTAVFLGIKHHRDKVLGGVIGFVPALLVGLGISAVASLFWAIGWEISLAYSGFDFAQSYGDMLVAAAQERGASEAEIREIVAEAAEFSRMYANPLFRFPITFVEMFPLGVLISLASAAMLRNSRFLASRGSH